MKQRYLVHRSFKRLLPLSKTIPPEVGVVCRICAKNVAILRKCIERSMTPSGGGGGEEAERVVEQVKAPVSGPCSKCKTPDRPQMPLSRQRMHVGHESKRQGGT